jgi:hypothetical protein
MLGYYGQEEAVIEAQKASGFNNVRQDFLLFDVLRVGPDVETKVQGWETTLTALAAADTPISFFDQRQESETGVAYSNMKKKTGLDWPVIFTDFGIGFFYPDPVNTDMYDGDRASSKMWSQILPLHMNAAIYVGGADNKILSVRPEMCPYGFGAVGNQVGGNLAQYASLITQGDSLAGNRFIFKNLPLKLPKDISISVKLTLTAAAKRILNAMNTVKPIVFENGVWNNECMIIAAFRGMRDVQPIGDFHR